MLLTTNEYFSARLPNKWVCSTTPPHILWLLLQYCAMCVCPKCIFFMLSLSLQSLMGLMLC